MGLSPRRRAAADVEGVRRSLSTIAAILLLALLIPATAAASGGLEAGDSRTAKSSGGGIAYSTYLVQRNERAKRQRAARRRARERRMRLERRRKAAARRRAKARRRAAKPPAPAPPSTGYAFPIQGPFSWGGEDSRFDDILIRGYDAGSTSTNMYRDGLRVPAGGQWTRTQFDVFGLESIEVLKGPSAVLFGQVAPGGLVNMTSKRPAAEHRGMVSTQYGSFDTWQAAADISGPIDGEGQFLYRIAPGPTTSALAYYGIGTAPSPDFEIFLFSRYCRAMAELWKRSP